MWHTPYAQDFLILKITKVQSQTRQRILNTDVKEKSQVAKCFVH
jgi:hypothetical protein